MTYLASMPAGFPAFDTISRPHQEIIVRKTDLQGVDLDVRLVLTSLPLLKPAPGLPQMVTAYAFDIGEKSQIAFNLANLTQYSDT